MPAGRQVVGPRVLGFHVLRHTFINNLARALVHPKEAQELARHLTVTLTMGRYTHIGRGKLAAALEPLPNLTDDGPESQRLQTTGAYDGRTRLPLSLPESGAD